MIDTPPLLPLPLPPSTLPLFPQTQTQTFRLAHIFVVCCRIIQLLVFKPVHHHPKKSNVKKTEAFFFRKPLLQL